MKTKVLNLFCMFLSLHLVGQNVQVSSAIVGPSGISEEVKTINISKWQLGQVYQIVLNDSYDNNDATFDGEVTVYPNPTFNIANLKFKMPERAEFEIKVTDITQKEIFSKFTRSVDPEEVLQIDVSKLMPAIYLLKIYSLDGKKTSIQKIVKI